MITIAIGFFNRKNQFKNTINSILASSIKDIFITLVDDASDNEHILSDSDFCGIAHNVIRIEPINKTWCNPCIANNIALKNIPSETDVILLQNPENIHVGDVLKKCIEVNDNEYHVFACYCLQHDSSLGTAPISRRGISNNVEGWICHPNFDNNIYNYAVAFTPNTLSKIGYFNERFANGLCRDDDEFGDRVQSKGLKVVKHIDPYVKHQYHEYVFSQCGDFNELFNKNDQILQQIRRGK